MAREVLIRWPIMSRTWVDIHANFRAVEVGILGLHARGIVNRTKVLNSGNRNTHKRSVGRIVVFGAVPIFIVCRSGSLVVLELGKFLNCPRHRVERPWFPVVPAVLR